MLIRIIAGTAIAFALAACGGKPAPEMMRIATMEAQQFKSDAEIFLESVNSINGCIPERKEANQQTDVAASGDIQNDDGRVNYYMGARTNKSNGCID